MKPLLALSALATSLLCAASAHAQLYKWVGPDGKVTYSDTPPPAVAAHVETKSIGSSGPGVTGLTYELAQAAKNQPVTLYTTPECAPCNDGRSLLSQRGIPFTEKTVSSREDTEQFKKIASDGRLPVLVVGRSKEQGYEPGAWNTALTAAGYPQNSQLPSGYRNPPPEPLTGEVKAVAKPAAVSKQDRSAAAAPTAPLPAAGNAPPGFRF